MLNYPYRDEGLTVLRVTLGLFFIISGLMKLFNQDLITGLLTDLGFPAAGFLGWLVLLTEIIFGLLVLIGWKLGISVWPLVIILVVAVIKVYVPQLSINPLVATINILFHLTTIAGFITLALAGPGKLAVTRLLSRE